MLTRPPVNHVVHSGPRESSRTASHGSENSIPRSSTTAGQKRSGSSTEMRWSSRYPSAARRRASRVTFARSTISGVGAQT